MRRYNGNTGRYEYIEDAPPRQVHGPERELTAYRASEQHSPNPVGAEHGMPGQSLPKDILGSLQNTLAKLFRQGFENEDLLLFAVLFLMYQETKDKELLIIMGGMFLL